MSHQIAVTVCNVQAYILVGMRHLGMPHMSLPVSCMITIYGSFSAVLQDMAEWGQVRRL